MCFCRLLIFKILTFFRKIFLEYHQSDLDPNCLQKLSADDTREQIVKPDKDEENTIMKKPAISV